MKQARTFLFLILSLFIFSSHDAKGQELINLFNFLEHPPELDSKAVSIMNKIATDSTVQKYFFVTINPIESIIMDKYVPIRLPFNLDTLFNFSSRQIKYIDENHYIWHGFLYEKDSIYMHSGHGTLISNDGKKFGTFRLDSIYIDLLDLGDNINVLVQYKHSDEILTCGVGELDSVLWPVPPDSSTIAEFRGSGPCPINVLILFYRESREYGYGV